MSGPDRSLGELKRLAGQKRPLSLYRVDDAAAILADLYRLTEEEIRKIPYVEAVERFELEPKRHARGEVIVKASGVWMALPIWWGGENDMLQSDSKESVGTPMAREARAIRAAFREQAAMHDYTRRLRELVAEIKRLSGTIADELATGGYTKISWLAAREGMELCGAATWLEARERDSIQPSADRFAATVEEIERAGETFGVADRLRGDTVTVTARWAVGPVPNEIGDGFVGTFLSVHPDSGVNWAASPDVARAVAETHRAAGGAPPRLEWEGGALVVESDDGRRELRQPGEDGLVAIPPAPGSPWVGVRRESVVRLHGDGDARVRVEEQITAAQSQLVEDVNRITELVELVGREPDAKLGFTEASREAATEAVRLIDSLAARTTVPRMDRLRATMAANIQLLERLNAECGTAGLRGGESVLVASRWCTDASGSRFRFAFAGVYVSVHDGGVNFLVQPGAMAEIVKEYDAALERSTEEVRKTVPRMIWREGLVTIQPDNRWDVRSPGPDGRYLVPKLSGNPWVVADPDAVDTIIAGDGSRRSNLPDRAPNETETVVLEDGSVQQTTVIGDLTEFFAKGAEREAAAEAARRRHESHTDPVGRVFLFTAEWVGRRDDGTIPGPIEGVPTGLGEDGAHFWLPRRALDGLVARVQTAREVWHTADPSVLARLPVVRVENDILVLEWADGEIDPVLPDAAGRYHIPPLGFPWTLLPPPPDSVVGARFLSPESELRWREATRRSRS